MCDLFKCCRRRLKSLREILRLREEQIDSIEQGRFRMEQARITQNRGRLVEMLILHFELRKLEESRRDRRRLYVSAAQIVKQLPSSLSAPGANFEPSKIPSRECSPWLFGIAYPFLEAIA